MSKVRRERAFGEATEISRREAARVFGRELGEVDARLIAAFREGLDPSSRKAFWELYYQLLSGRNSRASDMSRTVATHHLKAAGALSSKSRPLAMTEILAALRTDPATTLGWLATRYLNV